jgi:L-threonylcarbamoyladenylate synthase
VVLRVADSAAMAAAADLIRAGDLVGLPTETVYGLAGDATNPRAVAAIFAVKGRPQFNPLIAHVAGLDMAREEAVLDERALTLAARFWPGPLTLVAPARPTGRVCELARAGLPTVALRMPRHPVALGLIRAVDRPLAAPSANRSGHISPTSAAHVLAEFGDAVRLVLDGGPAQVGIESTVVAALPGQPLRLLRPGGITRDELMAVVGDLAGAEAGVIASPGQLTSHYAPRAPLRLDVTDPAGCAAYLGFGACAAPDQPNLSPAGDLVEAAARLFGLLRELDQRSPAEIAVAPIPHTGLGEAINDRLRRAAAGR